MDGFFVDNVLTWMTGSDSVLFAFALSFAAGMATTVGAFLPFCIDVHRPQVLAVALAGSAGVMIYVSFVEIFVKSVSAFEQEVGERWANFCATIAFFGGIASMMVLDKLVHAIEHRWFGESDPFDPLGSGLADLDMLNPNFRDVPDGESVAALPDSIGIVDGERKRLHRTGVMTAVSIFIHNVPEGIVTFAGALADPRLGIGLAVAIGLHNACEGVVVAVPIYVATGSRWKGVAWGFLSGVAEPVGALLTWLVLGTEVSQMAFAVMFGMVAGVMVFIAHAELLDQARHYDSSRKPLFAFLTGMLMMALSIALFSL